LQNQSSSTRRTGEGMNLAVEMHSFATRTIGSVPHKGGGNVLACAAQSGSMA
jgi:hypothetical protein